MPLKSIYIYFIARLLTHLGTELLKSKINNRVILALDVTDVDRAIDIATKTSEYVDAIKVGLPLALTTGLCIIDKIRKHTDSPVIADIKIGDIPEIAAELARTCFDMGFDAITVHGFVGPTAIEDCVFESNGLKDVIVITEITHQDAEKFMQPVSEAIASMAKRSGASGIQAPGTRPERVRLFRRIVGDGMLIVACGIGAQGGQLGSAIEAGADFEIIGRMIYNAADPKSVAKEISQKLRSKNETRNKCRGSCVPNKREPSY